MCGEHEAYFNAWWKWLSTSWNPVSKSDLQSHKILHDGALYPFNPSLPTPAPLATSLQMDPLSWGACWSLLTVPPPLIDLESVCVICFFFMYLGGHFGVPGGIWHVTDAKCLWLVWVWPSSYPAVSCRTSSVGVLSHSSTVKGIINNNWHADGCCPLAFKCFILKLATFEARFNLAH